MKSKAENNKKYSENKLFPNYNIYHVTNFPEGVKGLKSPISTPDKNCLLTSN